VIARFTLTVASSSIEPKAFAHRLATLLGVFDSKVRVHRACAGLCHGTVLTSNCLRGQFPPQVDVQKISGTDNAVVTVALSTGAANALDSLDDHTLETLGTDNIVVMKFEYVSMSSLRICLFPTTVL
jgi:hypothetical protein